MTLKISQRISDYKFFRKKKEQSAPPTMNETGYSSWKFDISCPQSVRKHLILSFLGESVQVTCARAFSIVP